MKKTSTLDRALAIANLVNLGRSATESFDISRDWAQRQLAQSLQAVDQLVSESSTEMPWPDAPLPGRMFASFHFSLYALLYSALGQRSGPRVVYSLIGQQDEGHRNALKAIAVKHGFQIEFIQSNLGMVKSLRRAIADGIPGILLLDIPWTRQESEPDARYRVTGGCFKGLSSLERLLAMIDPAYEILVTRRVGEKFKIDNAGHLTLQDAFKVFGQALDADPADYERLHQFHRFFEFDVLQNCAVTFCIQNKRYVLYAKTMQAWELSSGLKFEQLQDGVDAVCNDPAIVAAISKEIKHELDYVISI